MHFMPSKTVHCIRDWHGKRPLHLCVCSHPLRRILRGNVHAQSWPQYDEGALVQDEIEVVLQINGKVRDRVKIAADLDRESMERIVVELPRAKELNAGKTVVKVICVPGKLVNIVVRE